MQLLLVSVLMLAVTVGTYAEAEAQFYYPPVYPTGGYDSNYYRAGQIQPSHDIKELKNEARFLFTTLSFTLVTNTISTTSTLTTTCTTSTAALIQCTNSGRRRRGISFDNGAGLYYSEDGQEESPFLPINKKEEEKSVEPEPSVREVRETPAIPFVVQPGFSAPNGNARVMLYFGTSTVTSTALATTTVSVTAICRSTSSYQLCGSTGK